MGNDAAEMQRKIFAKNLNDQMNKLGISQDDIVKALGYSSSTVSDWCNAKKYPRVSKMQELADYLGVSLFALREDHAVETASPNIPPGFEPLPPMAKLPLVGAIACGQPITAEENLEGAVNVPEEWGADFVLTCRGDSMAPKIEDGDLVAIRIQPEVANGQIAAVRIDSEATLKKVYRYPDRLELRPVNPDFEIIVLYGEDINTAAIEGLAVGLCRGI